MNRCKSTFKKLDDTISLLLREGESGGMGFVRDKRVKSAIRELNMSRKGGRLDTDRLVRAVSLLSEAACDTCLTIDGD